MSLYQNKNYVVTLPEAGLEYEVVNTETGVVEFKSASLPRAIIVAQESDSALDRFLPKPEPEGPTDATNVRSIR